MVDIYLARNKIYDFVTADQLKPRGHHNRSMQWSFIHANRSLEFE